MRRARLGDVVVSMKNGLYKPASEYADDGTPCLRMYNIDSGSIVWRDIKRMRVSAAELEEYGLREGDLLVNRVNSRELVGKAAYIPTSLEPSVFESKNIRVRLDASKALPKFINYQLLAGSRRHFAGNAQQVVGMASISQKQLADFPIVLADLNEQRRIVAEVEKQFSRLDEAVANLKRVKANLKRYKAAVFKAAVEGRLVSIEAEHARRAGRSYETGAQLLERIMANIPRSVRAAQNKWPITESETGMLRQLPEGWSAAPIGRLAELVEYGSSAKTSEANVGVPVLRMGNIVEGDLDLTALKYLPHSHAEFPRLLLQPGDLLFNRTNSPELVGKTAVYTGRPEKCSFASYLIRVRLAPGCLPEFVSTFINSIHGRRWVKTVVTQQVGQANVNGTKLQNLVVPIPPLPEQERIVTEVGARLAQLRALSGDLDANLQRAEALRSAVLATTMRSC